MKQTVKAYSHNFFWVASSNTNKIQMKSRRRSLVSCRNKRRGGGRKVRNTKISMKKRGYRGYETFDVDTAYEIIKKIRQLLKSINMNIPKGSLYDNIQYIDDNLDKMCSSLNYESQMNMQQYITEYLNLDEKDKMLINLKNKMDDI